MIELTKPSERSTSTRFAPVPLSTFYGAAVVTTFFMGLTVSRAGPAPWRVLHVGMVATVAVLLLLLVRLGYRVAALPTVIIGTMVASTGHAFGIQLQRAQGWSWLAVMGCVSFLGGLVLIAWGTWFAICWLRGRGRAIALVVGLLVVKMVLLDSVVVPIADGLALANGPRFGLSETTPADLGMTFESVMFRAADGVVLSGWYLPSENGVGVVLAHGASSTRSSVLRHAAVIARHGYGVLMFDSRGQGQSEGYAMNLGWCGDADLSGAVSYVADRQDVERYRVAVVGLSLGGEEAIGMAAKDQRVQAVVAEGASYRVLGDWTPDSDGGWVERTKERLTFATAAVVSNCETPSVLVQAAVDAAPRQILLIQSGAGTEITAGRGLATASPSNIEVWEIPTAGHIDGLGTEPVEWERRVIGFLDANL